MNTGGKNEQIRVARIAAWQAVLVALITAAAGVFAGYLARSTAPTASQLGQHYLIIEGVSGTSGDLVRVVARVNNLLYAYPADVAFTPISSSMPEQKLVLPVTGEPYTLSFEAQIKSEGADDVKLFRSRATPQFDPRSLPTEMQKYELLLVGAGGNYSSEALSVKYSFR